MDDGKYFVCAPTEHRYPRELSRYNDHEFTRFDGKTVSLERGMKEYPIPYLNTDNRLDTHLTLCVALLSLLTTSLTPVLVPSLCRS